MSHKVIALGQQINKIDVNTLSRVEQPKNCDYVGWKTYSRSRMVKEIAVQAADWWEWSSAGEGGGQVVMRFSVSAAKTLTPKGPHYISNNFLLKKKFHNLENFKLSFNYIRSYDSFISYGPQHWHGSAVSESDSSGKRSFYSRTQIRTDFIFPSYKVMEMVKMQFGCSGINLVMPT